jgi:GAF domain-containing protein
MNRKQEQEQLALASELSRILAAGGGIEALGTDVIFELQALLSIDWTAICLLDHRETATHLLPLSTRVDSGLDLGDTTPLEGTPLGWVIDNKRALVQDIDAAEGRFRTDAAWQAKGIRSLAHMPLFSEGRVFGSLIFGSRRPRAHGDRELRLLRYTAIQIAPHIRHSESLAGIIEGTVHSHLPNDERMERVERALGDFAAAMETYARHLASHTEAVTNLSRVSEQLREAADEQNRILGHLADKLESAPDTDQRPVRPEPPEPEFPAGCAMNRPSRRRGSLR